MRCIRLASRRSPLALAQTHLVAQALRTVLPRLRVQIVAVSATGDQDQSTPLHRFGTVGVFAKEVQHLLLSSQADVGVHSCKDLPTAPVDGLHLAATLPREDPRDCLIGAASIAALPKGALIGTSSLRRRAQVLALRDDCQAAELRGNVATRLGKISGTPGEGHVHAAIMAYAGLRRVGLHRSSNAVPLCPERELTPAPAQGALAIECRHNDPATRRLLERITHQPTFTALSIERTVLAGLAGGCSLPLGCLARPLAGGRWQVIAFLARGPELKEQRRVVVEGSAGTVAEETLKMLQR